MRLFGLVLLLGTISLEADVPIRLKYHLEAPIQEMHEIQVNMSHALPQFKLESLSSQLFAAEIAPLEDQNGIHNEDSQQDISFTFNEWQVGLNLNGFDINTSSRTPGNSVEAFLQSLLQKTFQLSINTNEASILYKPNLDFPEIMKDKDWQKFFTEWFQHLLIWANQDVKLGLILVKDTLAPWPAKWTYEITDITEKEVTAKINAEILPITFTLSRPSVEGEESKLVQFILKGQAAGTGSWSISNAFHHHSDIQVTLKGDLISEEKINESLKIEFIQTMRSIL